MTASGVIHSLYQQTETKGTTGHILLKHSGEKIKFLVQRRMGKKNN